MTTQMNHSRSGKTRGVSRKRIAHALVAAPLAAALIFAWVPGNANAASGMTNSAAQLTMMTINVKGKTLNVPSILTDGTTYVGLRFLSQELGMKTGWQQSTGTVTVSNSTKTMSMKDGSDHFSINGHRINGTAPIIKDGTTYLPMRFLLEQMGYAIGYDAKTKLVTVSLIVENPVELKNISVTDDANNKYLSVQYPQLEGLSNHDAQSKINAELKDKGEKDAQDGREFLKESGKYAKYEVNYNVTYNEKNKLSIYFEKYVDSGGAHGLYTANSHTFDLATGKELSLKEAVSNNPDYIHIINKEVKSQLEQRGIMLSEPFKTIQANQRFFLRGNSVIVYFDDTSTAVGIVQISIPLSKFAK